MGRSIRAIAVLAATLLVAALAPAGALGSTGEVTAATVSPDWQQGDFAGTVTWDGCAHPAPKPSEAQADYVECTWTPYATVGPGVDSENCLSTDRQLGHLGSEVHLVWQGEERVGVGTQSFEASDFELDGSSGQVLCLGAREMTNNGTMFPCVPLPGPPPPGWHCPYVPLFYYETFDARVLEPPGEEPDPESEPAPSGEEPESEPLPAGDPELPPAAVFCACLDSDQPPPSSEGDGTSAPHQQKRRWHHRGHRHHRLSISRHKKVSKL